MSLITISATLINYTSGTTECQLSVSVNVPPIGPTFVAMMASLTSADLAEDWTDAQLCEAVAAKLGVPVADVSVAEAPVPPASPQPPAPVDGGKGDEVGGEPVYKPVVAGV